MARIRTIKPEFWKHEGLSELPEATILLAIALLNCADDEGYFNANPKLIKADCCPLREPSVTIQCSLSELSNAGYLQLGSCSNGRVYGHILNFGEHQVINRPKPSKIKPLDIVWEPSLTSHGLITDESLGKGKEQGTGNRDQGKELMEASPPADDDLEIPSHLDRRFAWQGKVIRLSKRDLDQWKASFPRLDLLGELLARDQYLAAQPPDVQAKWFASTSQHLANRNMKAKAGEAIATAPPPIQKTRTELAYDKVAAKIEAMENGTDLTEKGARRGQLLIGQRVLSDAEPGGTA